MATTPATTRSAAGTAVTVSLAVIESVSTATDTPTHELPPLHDAIDPDALNALFDARTTRGSVRFQYADCMVTVHADHTIEVSRAD